MILATVIGGLVICSLLVTAVGTAWLEPAPPPTPADREAEPPVEYQRALEAALTANPNDATALMSLANLHATQGDHRTALAYYEQAIAVEPDDVGYRLDFALSLAESGSLADAELQYRRALAIEPANAEAHYFLGELYARWTPARNPEALASFERAIAASPASVSAQQAQVAVARLRGRATPAVPS